MSCYSGCAKGSIFLLSTFPRFPLYHFSTLQASKASLFSLFTFVFLGQGLSTVHPYRHGAQKGETEEKSKGKGPGQSGIEGGKILGHKAMKLRDVKKRKLEKLREEK